MKVSRTIVEQKLAAAGGRCGCSPRPLPPNLPVVHHAPAYPARNTTAVWNNWTSEGWIRNNVIFAVIFSRPIIAGTWNMASS